MFTQPSGTGPKLAHLFPFSPLGNFRDAYLRQFAKPIVVCTGFLVAFACASAFADTDQVSMRKIDDSNFEITLRSKTITNVTAATSRIATIATSLCGDRYVDLGRYKFEKSESVTGPKEEDWFEMVQRLKCVAENPRVAPQLRIPQLEDNKAVEDVRKRVRELSKQHFEQMYSNLGEDASVGLKNLGAPQDAGSSSSSKTVRGAKNEINLYRITVYDNIPEAPAKGIYVAVDYDNLVGNVAHHCGYLTWHTFDALKFTLGRVETGVLEEKLLTKLSTDELYAIRKNLRCANAYDE